MCYIGFFVHGFNVCMAIRVNSWNVSTELKKKINWITAVLERPLGCRTCYRMSNPFSFCQSMLLLACQHSVVSCKQEIQSNANHCWRCNYVGYFQSECTHSRGISKHDVDGKNHIFKTIELSFWFLRLCSCSLVDATVLQKKCQQALVTLWMYPIIPQEGEV